MAEQARSEGARYERAAMRARLRRRIQEENDLDHPVGERILTTELNWVLQRQSRYDKAPGGLGRTIRKR